MNIVMFSFYKKEVSSNQVLGPDSGFIPNVLRNILLQEFIRRLMNCSKELDWTEKTAHLSKFNLLLKKSGHRENFRLNLTNRAIEIYLDRLKQPNLFRTKDQVIQASKNKPSKADWFKTSGDFDVVLNVPPLLGQELIKSVHETLTKITPGHGIHTAPAADGAFRQGSKGTGDCTRTKSTRCTRRGLPTGLKGNRRLPQM